MYWVMISIAESGLHINELKPTAIGMEVNASP